jgi:hypothetical protein
LIAKQRRLKIEFCPAGASKTPAAPQVRHTLIKRDEAPPNRGMLAARGKVVPAALGLDPASG